MEPISLEPTTVPTLLTRRATLTLAAAALATPALAQRSKGPESVPLDALLKPGTIPDLALGKVEAPVTIVEYASKTCGHCANFHTKVYPTVKEKYVDTGKVRFIYREFALDDRALAASMLARCTGTPDKALAMASILYAKQEEWAFVRTNPVPELFKIARQAGFTQEAFDKCLTDQKLLDDVTAIRERGSKEFQVSATPTMFINGKRYTGRTDNVEEFTKAIDAAMPKS